MEAVSMEVLGLIEGFKLEHIPTETVDSLLKGEALSEFDLEQLGVLTAKIDVDAMAELSAKVRDICKKEGETDGTRCLWSFMTGRKFSHRALLGVLFYFVNNKRHEELGFSAAGLYLQLVQIPGSMAYNIFHPFIFRSVLGLLKSWHANSAPDQPAKQQRPQKGKSKKKRNDTDLDQADARTLSGWVVVILKELYLFLEAFPLHQDSFNYTLEILTDLTRFRDDFVPDSRARGSQKLNKKARGGSGIEQEITKLAFDTLHRLLQPVLSDPDADLDNDAHQMVREVFKNLLPSLLMTAGQGGTPIPKHKIATRDNTLEFLSSLISEINDIDVPKGNPEKLNRKQANRKSNKDQLYSSVHALLQHTCAQVPDKAEYRTQTCQTVVALYGAISKPESPRFLTFLSRYSKNAKASYRLFAVQVAMSLVELSSDGEEQSCKALLEVILSRSSDKIASVRARALTSIAALLQQATDNAFLKAQLYQLITLQGSSDGRQDFLALLVRRADDEKCNVRRVAIQALETVGILSEELILGKSELRHLVEKCGDSALSIRKQAMTALSGLMKEHPSHPLLYRAWLVGVLPLVADPEASVQQKCLDDVYSIVFERIIRAKREDPSASVWLLVGTIDGDLQRYLQRCCVLLARDKRLTKPLAQALVPAVVADTKGSWMLLSEVSEHIKPHIDPAPILASWYRLADASLEASTAGLKVYVLKVLYHIADRISPSDAKQLADDLLSRLKGFSCTPADIQAMMQTLTALCKGQAHSDKEAAGMIDQWASALLLECDQNISSYVLGNQTPSYLHSSDSDSFSTSDIAGEPSAEKLVAYLYTLGEISQVKGKGVPSRLVTVIQALVAPTLPSHDQVMGSPASTRTIPHSLRGYAFIALGKLCLEDEALAKKCIAAFARELETSDSPIVRNNVIVIMCDLCIRYTSLVDRYVGNVANCIRDSSELVRRQTLLLLTRLLQEDYVKWKGTLFYRFVVALVDDSNAVRQFANFCLVNMVQSKNATMFFNHFVDTIFHLNDCRQHPSYNQLPQTAKEQELFSFRGPNNKRKRHTIYKLLLQHMTDEQKLNITAKLCQDVLGAVVDGIMPLEADSDDTPKPSAQVLSDVLEILMSKDIKVSFSKSPNAAEDDEGAEDEGEAKEAAVPQDAMAAAKGKILSQIVKKNVIENIVPIIASLKQVLESKHSPLLGPLMLYLTDLMKEHKSDIADIMVSDKQLAKELDYDIRQFNMKKKRMSLQALSPVIKRTADSLSFSPAPSARPRRISLAATPSRSPLPQIAIDPTNLSTLPVPKLRTDSPAATPVRGSRLSISSTTLPTTPRATFASPAPVRRTTLCGTPLSRLAMSTPLRTSEQPRADIHLPSPFRDNKEVNQGSPVLRRKWAVELTPRSQLKLGGSPSPVAPEQEVEQQKNLQAAPAISSNENDEFLFDKPRPKRIARRTKGGKVTPLALSPRHPTTNSNNISHHEAEDQDASVEQAAKKRKSSTSLAKKQPAIKRKAVRSKAK